MSEFFNDGAAETNEGETADAGHVDHPAAQALLDAQAEYQRKSSGLLEGYYKSVDEIRDNTKVDIPFPDVLSDEQKSRIIASKKTEDAQDLHQKTVEKYEVAVERFSKHAHKHTAKLRADLFNVGEGGSVALSQAVAADEEQLIRVIELADLAGYPTIVKAAFAAGVVRGDAPKAVKRYLDSNPETESHLRVYQQAPKPEWFETTRSNIPRMIKPPTEDQLRGRPRVTPFG
jgi:hypothetical protein